MHVTDSEDRGPKTEAAYERPALQPCLYPCCIKIKCCTIVCIASPSSKVCRPVGHFHRMFRFHNQQTDFYLCRYLSVKWSIDLSKVILFMGERGDTDYEDLLGGLHKTVILRGLEMNVHSDDGLKMDDIVISQDSIKVALAQGFGVDDISKALGHFGIM